MPPSQFSPTVETVHASFFGITEIVALSNGNVLIAWGGAQWRLIDPAGTILNATSVLGSEINPGLEAVPMSDGGFVVTWAFGMNSFRPPIFFPIPQPGQPVTLADVYAASYDATGRNRSTGESVITEPRDHPLFGAVSYEDDPAVALHASGAWVVLYNSANGDIGMRSSGTPFGATVNVARDGRQSDPTVTALADNSFVATWTSFNAGDNDIIGRKISAAGVPVGGEFFITTLPGRQVGAQVAALASGGFVVVWENDDDVKGRRFDANGNPLGAEFDLGTATAGVQTAPHVASYPGGGFVAVWVDSSNGTFDGNQIVARVFAEDGTPTTGQFVVNWAANAAEAFPGVTVLPDGSLEFIWAGIGSGPGSGLRTRIFVPGTEVGDIAGTAGVDVLTGDAGDNILSGLGGADTLVGGGGSDTALYATSPGAVSVDLAGIGSGRDAQGDSYSSVENVIGSAFNDVLAGDAGVNRLDGGGGDDLLQGRAGADALIGGAGIDTADYSGSSSAFINLTLAQGFNNSAHGDTYDGIENVAGSSFDDVLIGDAGANRLDGAGGNDILLGALGADVLVGGAGIDMASYEDNQGAVLVNLTFGRGFGNAAEGDAYSGIENVAGTSVADVIIGTTGVNVLNGNDGDDILVGSAGADTMNGGNGSDTASYEDNWGAVFINLSLGRGFGNAADGDVLNGIENVAGTSVADMIIGTTGVNVLNGNDGDDILVGSVGADTLNGGNGADTASYEDNWGAVFINLNTGLGFGNAAEGDVLNSIENATGSIFNDALIGSDGANRLGGNAGNDMLVGHGGADQFVFDTALNAATNLDTISDFAPGVDKILLDNAIFAGLGEGTLGPAAFIAGPRARIGANRIVYDQETGALYYDADGFGGDPAVQFATLANRPALTAADFLVI